MKSGDAAPKSVSTPILAWPFIFLIYLYRATLSPFLGGSCRFYPSCSRYAEDALRAHGPFRGSIMAIKRLLRCHPCHDGGYDPVAK
ncbi:MAG: membrane protein insertion efficiency factor YidD [candidate division Zixibacteria bacterium]|nr:membrane protein insertion efficiency factor YidD [candidate division Zixibacteria bacterium]